MMAADIYTKAFSDPDNWSNALSLINIIDPKDLVQFASNRKMAGLTDVDAKIKGVIKEDTILFTDTNTQYNTDVTTVDAAPCVCGDNGDYI